MNYESIKLDKSMYKADGGFSAQLERLDPSHKYKGTNLEGLDAYQRQLKRFAIKVNGASSDTISKFFSTSDAATLFPEYISRSVAQGAQEANLLEDLVAAKTEISSMDYRSFFTEMGDAVTAAEKLQWSAAGESGCSCGTYTGSGASTRTVQLPGTPAFGLLFAVGQTISYHSFSKDNFRSYSGFFSPAGCSEGIVLSGDQLTLTHSTTARMDGSELYYNGNGITYVYVFWS